MTSCLVGMKSCKLGSSDNVVNMSILVREKNPMVL